MAMSDIMDTFWDKYSNFEKHRGRGDFADVVKYATEDVRAGRSHMWHEKYSLPYTKVLGYVACRVCSKLAGIGAAERSWGDVKCKAYQIWKTLTYQRGIDREESNSLHECESHRESNSQ